jgi:hypothetical protein
VFLILTLKAPFVVGGRPTFSGRLYRRDGIDGDVSYQQSAFAHREFSKSGHLNIDMMDNIIHNDPLYDHSPE